MMILSAFGIIFVVDNHCGEPLGFLTSLFPYNSYFMPMFVFISGYFFKSERTNRIIPYLFDKAKKLLKPYYVHNIVLGGGITVLVSVMHFSWAGDFSLYNLFGVAFSWGTIFDVTSASWFVVMLFSVVSLYACIHRFYGQASFIKDSLYLVLLVIIGATAVHLSMEGYSKDIRYILALKTAFYIQFYHFGAFYKKYIDNQVRINSLYLCLISVFLSLCLHLLYSNNQLNFNSTAFMQSFESHFVFLPFLTSALGIIFFLNFSKFLTPLLRENKIINEISENTLIILTSHLIFFNLINFLLYFLCSLGYIQNFNIEFFQRSAWYIYSVNPVYKWLYLFVGLFGPLLLKRCCIGKLLKL